MEGSPSTRTGSKRQRSSGCDVHRTPSAVPPQRAGSDTKKRTRIESPSESIVSDVRHCHPSSPSGEKRIFRMRSAIDADRLSRALSQRLFLIDTVGAKPQEDQHTRKFIVLGSTGNVYTVTIGPEPCCTCPDGEKGNVCKHILFVFIRVLKIPRTSALIAQRALLKSELAAIFSHADKSRKVKKHKRRFRAIKRRSGN